MVGNFRGVLIFIIFMVDMPVTKITAIYVKEHSQVGERGQNILVPVLMYQDVSFFIVVIVQLMVPSTLQILLLYYFSEI